MKFRITMKDPDTLYDACGDAAEAQVKEVEGIDEEERSVLAESRAATLRDLCSPWFEYGEYLTVEVDTETKTRVVVSRDDR